MGLDLVLDPPLTAGLRTHLLDLWVRVVNAGGAVGFVPPVTGDDVRPTAEDAFAGVDAGVDHALVGFEGGRPVALLFLAGNRHALKGHWRTVKRVMVDPGAQGRGYGAALMREAERVARTRGWAGLHVTVRGGTGLDRFYAGLGFKEVGRLPGALRVADGDDRDEILMWVPLA